MLDSSGPIEPIFMLFSIPVWFLFDWLDFEILKHIGIKSDSFKSSFYLSLRFLIQFFFFFFLSFSWSKFPRFFSSIFGKTFIPFLFHHITCFHAFFINFFRDFCTLENLGFLIKIEFLFKSKPWVFVHASFKHDSHTLISKNLSFIGNFEIRVLSSWEFGDCVKLANVIDKLNNYNLFYTCCVVQLINIRISKK